MNEPITITAAENRRMWSLETALKMHKERGIPSEGAAQEIIATAAMFSAFVDTGTTGGAA